MGPKKNRQCDPQADSETMQQAHLRNNLKTSLISAMHSLHNYEIKDRLSYNILLEKQVRIIDLHKRFVEVVMQCELSNANREEYEEIEEEYMTLLSRIKILLDDNLQYSNQMTKSPSNNHHHMCSPPATFQTQQSIRLPEVSIPKFNGDFANWTNFKEIFTALIIRNTTLEDVTRFHHLNTALEGEPLVLLRSLPASALNFQVAWDLLCRRYDNSRLIISSYLKKLFKPPQLQSGSPQSLRAVLDHFVSNYNALKAMQNEVSLDELLISQLLLESLDVETLREWEGSSNTNNMPSLKDLTTFIEKRCKILDLGNINRVNDEVHFKQRSYQPRPTSKQDASKCACCTGSHPIYLCPDFGKMSSQKRMSVVTDKKLCRNCLRPYSPGHNCSKGTCRHCDKRHHTLLHVGDKNYSTNSQMHSNVMSANANPTSHANVINSPVSVDVPEHVEAQVSPQKSSNVSFCALPAVHNSRCLLATASVRIKSNDGSYVQCTAIMDSGSNCNLITQSLVDRLQLKTFDASTNISGIASSQTRATRGVSIEVNASASNWHTNLGAYVIPQIGPQLPPAELDPTDWNIPSNMILADPHFAHTKSIDLLLGSEIFYSVLTTGNIPLGTNKPVMQNTLLGWLIAGRLPCLQDSKRSTSHYSAFLSSNHEGSESTQFELSKFWQLEEIPSAKSLSTEDEHCEGFFLETTTRHTDGRYIVRLPRKLNAPTLGTSRSQAKRRFSSLEARFQRDSELKSHYREFMKEYEDLGHMLETSSNSMSNSDYYIPHHAVLKPSSTTTKLRVVFDASAKSSAGVSLNDTLAVGPVLQDDLFSQILKFRMHSVAFMADLTKMYRQIWLHPEELQYHRIFWRSDPSLPLKEYYLKTLTYGTAPASFLATRVLSQLVIDEGADYPIASQIIKDNFYMDDCLAGAPSMTEALLAYQQLNKLLAKAGFHLRKWSSNSLDLLKFIPDEDKETAEIRCFDDTSQGAVRALGLLWHPATDQFRIISDLSRFILISRYTKRTFLSCVASIFDPLGLISPILISCKILFQQLWLEKVEWDDYLPEHIHDQWLRILHTLPEIVKITIPRGVGHSLPTEALQIHGFADASNKAYGACLYLRVNHNGNVTVNLLCSKTKVAPVKTLSIPKLELSAALLLSNLSVAVAKSLQIPLQQVHLWSDSTIVLSQINSSINSKCVFTQNRVTTIRDATNKCKWSYVPSKDNPADACSRGLSAVQLKDCHLWWFGPSWLAQTSEVWPHSKVNHQKTQSFAHMSIPTTPIIDFTRFSSYVKLIRTIARCFKWLEKVRNRGMSCNTLITSSDLEKAELICVKLAQSETYSKEIVALKAKESLSPKSELHSLSPFLDQQGVIRLGGRLQNSDLPIDAKHQIILNAKHRVTRLIIEHQHRKLLHAGAQLVMANFRQLYWSPSLRRTVRTIIRSCVRCFRFKAQTAQQQMGALPEARTQAAFSFSKVGVDYAGPYYLKLGSPRSRKTQKVYLALFVCMSTKAVHIEIVIDLSTRAFLNALERFCSRRGVPSDIWSDNGTNFAGASNELNDLTSLLSSTDHQDRILESTAFQRIRWHFIPPRAPHFGGLWEAAVKAMKHHLRRATSSRSFTFEELHTLVCRVEGILNSRPLVSLTEDPSDFNYLSPAHFLTGRTLVSTPAANVCDDIVHYRKRWQLIQQITQYLWKRWSSDYLLSLQRLQKWHSQSPNIFEGTIVLLKEDGLPPAHWKLGRIVGVTLGRDNKVRVVRVQTAVGTFTRSIHKLAPLPIA